MWTKWTREPDGARYWVVGGRYADMSFRHLSWTAQTLGPFVRRRDAEDAWREISVAYSSECLVRFHIVEERIRLAA